MQYLLTHLLTDAASHWPDRTAVVAGPESLTYGELDAANRLGRDGQGAAMESAIAKLHISESWVKQRNLIARHLGL